MMAAPVAAQDERAPVRVDGRTLFRVGPVDDLTAEERADRVESRLEALLESAEEIPLAMVEVSGADERIVTIDGVPMVTVTALDAEDNLTTVNELARQWATAIDGALAEGQARRGRSQVFVLVEGAFIRLYESAREVLPRALATILILLLVGLIASLARRLMHYLFRMFGKDPTRENLIRQVVYYSIWVLGFLIAINALGFEPQALATGLGLTSLALGFALQDILSNFISGLLILVMRPFQLGDQIVVGPTEGVVEHIELRATRIRTYDGRVVLVPNAELFTSRVTNNTAAPIRRDSVTLNLRYDVDLNAATAVALEAIRASEGVLDEPPPSILVRDLGTTSIVLGLRFWTDSRQVDFVATRSRVSTAVVAALREAGIALPEGGTTVVMSSE